LDFSLLELFLVPLRLKKTAVFLHIAEITNCIQLVYILGLSHGIHDHPQYCCDLVTFLLSPVACLNARRGLQASCTTTARGLYKNYTCRAESKSGPCSPYMAIVGAVLMILFIIVPSCSHVFKA
jgi:hypothetical protein